VTERYLQGVLDTSVVIDLDEIPEESLPVHAAIGAVTLAELSQGPHLATDAETRAVRIERLQLVEATFHSPLPFNAACARKYGSLVAKVLAAGRSPKPRRIDLMIAATAASVDLPLYTRNPDDFKGIESSVFVVPV
jgi:predicted nucleic acid-binding protein